MNPENYSIVMRGVGSATPETRLTNAELTARVETSDEWITTRTGIKERRIAGDSLQLSEIAAEAGRKALANASMQPEEIDMIIVATLSPETLCPSTACLVQSRLGLRQVPAYDINVACSGWLYALDIARSMMLVNSTYRNVLVIGAEKLSSFTDWQDRQTCILFGDAAGATVLSRIDEPGYGVLGCDLGADGNNASLIQIPAGGSGKPATAETVEAREHFLRMNGKEVFKVAVKAMSQAAQSILEKNGATADDLVCIIPHQANIRIIEALSARLEIPMDRFFVNIQKYGNTSAASIPLGLDEARIERNFKRGDLILLVAFGAGLTWAASVVRWY